MKRTPQQLLQRRVLAISKVLYSHQRLNSIGWNVEKPKATMFVWAPIPAAYKEMGSIEFSKKMITDARVCASAHPMSCLLT
jgi:aspartate/methionine/tyrosine aminotransferase